jgi:hypothetical protein
MFNLQMRSNHGGTDEAEFRCRIIRFIRGRRPPSSPDNIQFDLTHSL